MSGSFAEAPDLHYRAAPCVFFDCDGVIFDSNGFKLDALRFALAAYAPPAVEQMARFWSENGGMSRYKKLEYFFREIEPVEDVAASVRATAARFGEFSRRAYVTVEPVREALVLADDAGPARSFVVSGTDQAELRDVFVEKGLNDRFAQVCGSPTTKLEHVSRILGERDCAPGSALFIGDGGGDFEACRTLGVPFVYLDQYSEWSRAAAVLADAPLTLWAATWPALLASLGVDG